MNDRKTELYNTREPAVPPRKTSAGDSLPPSPPPEGIIGDYDPPEEDMFWAKH